MTVHHRNTFERVVRAVREILTIVALVLASILMALLLATIGAVANRLGDTVGPEPSGTACPFGEGQCGG